MPGGVGIAATALPVEPADAEIEGRKRSSTVEGDHRELVPTNYHDMVG